MANTNRLNELETLLNNNCKSDCWDCKHNSECKEYEKLYREASEMKPYTNANQIFKGKKISDFNISDIEALTYDEAFLIADDIQEIKGHKIIFINFFGYFGYSYLVFLNHKHLYYANDYQLHHESRATIELLKAYYLEHINKKLFTIDELDSIANYKDYQKKSYYIRNYYPMQYDCKSAFEILNTKEKEEQFKKDIAPYPYFCDVSYSYYKDAEIVKHLKELENIIEAGWQKVKNDNEVFRKAIRYELNNHEACITMDYEDALGAMGLHFTRLDEEKKRIVKQELNKCIDDYANAM